MPEYPQSLSGTTSDTSDNDLKHGWLSRFVVEFSNILHTTS